MKEERLMNILVAPHISEKATLVAEKDKQITFKVSKDAKKTEIKEAVEMMFKVKVKKVGVLNVLGKTKRHGKTEGKRKNWKKAYVCLEKGYDINFIENE